MRIPCLLLPLVLSGCSGCSPEDSGTPWGCLIPGGESPDYAHQVGCWDDFAALASLPLDASIPGASSVKTVIDRSDESNLYFQNSARYPIHWDFAWANLSGGGLPLVPELGQFNATEYYSPTRRFLLGAVTFYEEPDVWAYEIATYDTADADMITAAYRLIRDNAYFGEELYFHPSSESVEERVDALGADVKVISTEELFADITYQPLNLGCSMGSLGFYAGDAIENVSAREIVVLDAVPNDISVVSGIITATWQTPLSHINVLSQNRGTPNMALRDAWDEPTLRDLEGRWIELCVEAMDWSVREVTQAEADAWWEEFRPDPLDVSPMDTSVTALTDEDEILDLEHLSLSAAITAAIPAFGGKATQYGALATIGEAVPHAPAFAIPVFYYAQHMEQAGLWPEVEAMLADEEFQTSAEARRARLEALQQAIEDHPIDPDFYALLLAKLEADYPGLRMRFRSSTNAEDLNGFNGAGLYTSASGEPGDSSDPVDEAVKEVWASLWGYRAYEEREYYGIRHTDIGMAVLVHRTSTDEEANGVAITANIYDTTGMEPAFYINVQAGEDSVVLPDSGVTTDIFLYYYDMPGQPVVYLGHSNLVEEGETVLSGGQIYALGTALKAIHDHFYEVYGGDGFYGMDVEFKFDDDWDDDPDDEPRLYVKQARPYPGWGG
ncbi:MAG: PEP/pyruvate-binding domain-containing protein [Pseudomonadota bacterium]